MVMGAVRALSGFSLHVSQQNHSDLSLAVIDDAQERFYKMKGAIWDQKMLKSSRAKLNEQLARESHQWREQRIHKIHAAMEVLVYGAEKVTTPKRRQFQVHLHRAWHTVTKWTEADRERAIEWLEREIHHMTPVNRKVFHKIFQHREPQILQVVRTRATSPRSTFARKLAQMKTTAEEQVYRAVNLTAHKCVECQIHLSDAETEATTCRIADTDRIVSQREGEIYCITQNEQMQFKKVLSICLIEFEA